MSYLGLQSPVAIAHRGGGQENLENSRSAFEHAVRLGFPVIETDVHASADGVLVVVHDPQLTRTTDYQYEVSQHPWSTLSQVRLRNGDSLLRLEELLEIGGDQVRINLDPKSDATVGPLVDFLRDRPQLQERVCLGSFETSRLKRLRVELPQVATSLGGTEIRSLVIASRTRIKWPRRSPAVAAQVPESASGIRIVSRQFVDYVHDMGMDVHVWTINAVEDMHRLYDMGVDGVMTDRPSVLREVLEARGQWRDAT
jgi:glycerophosphoryl diester phosphodiesterase